MLKRKMLHELKGWKAAGARKAFILLGARQVGKTYAVREFARQSYDSFVEVNFIESQESGAFLAASSSSTELLSRLSLVAGRSIPEGSLIFLDEVQQLGHDVVTLSKFIVEDGRFDLILSGSLLGTTLGGVTSFPVGYAQVRRMFPLDFEEFCWASGVPSSIIDELHVALDARTPVEDSLHDRMVRLFRQYIVVGGMPEAVATFFAGGLDLGGARQVCLDIVEQYGFDISKYAGERNLNVRSIYSNVPSQLAKENKRFQMASVRAGATHGRLRDDFAWLEEAGVVLPAHAVTEPKYPLQRTKVGEKFKLYSSDCGLLLAQYPRLAAMRVVSGEGDANFGAVYENVVAQELASSGRELWYFHNSRKGEVDFLLQTEDARVIPLEVKSGKDYKLHLALNNLLRTSDWRIDEALVLSEHNVSVEQRLGKPVYYLPLYMRLFLDQLVGAGHMGDMHLEPVEF